MTPSAMAVPTAATAIRTIKPISMFFPAAEAFAGTAALCGRLVDTKLSRPGVMGRLLLPSDARGDCRFVALPNKSSSAAATPELEYSGCVAPPPPPTWNRSVGVPDRSNVFWRNNADEPGRCFGA